MTTTTISHDLLAALISRAVCRFEGADGLMLSADQVAELTRHMREFGYEGLSDHIDTAAAGHGHVFLTRDAPFGPKVKTIYLHSPQDTRSAA